MRTLKEDIKACTDWIIKAFNIDNLKLDCSIESLMEIDRFFFLNMQDGKPKKGGRLGGENCGSILFSIGAYIGETILKNAPGTEWITGDEDPENDWIVSLKLPNGGIILPMQKVLKRFQNGSEDSIYPYVHSSTKEFTKHTFNKQFWEIERG